MKGKKNLNCKSSRFLLYFIEKRCIHLLREENKHYCCYSQRENIEKIEFYVLKFKFEMIRKYSRISRNYGRKKSMEIAQFGNMSKLHRLASSILISLPFVISFNILFLL